MQDIKESLLERFNAEYNKLNNAQKQAVDEIEGPVMVIAGPGTGKTQILSLRIGKILLETDVHPSNILCMTFTDAGSIAMRKRLGQLIGAAAFDVKINTFHSFCNEIIQKNIDEFNKLNLELVSDLEKAEYIRTVIDNITEDSLLKNYKKDKYSVANNLLKLFDNIKKENEDVDKIAVDIDEYIEQMPEMDKYIYKKATKGKKKGDLRPDYEKDKTKYKKTKDAYLLSKEYYKLLAEHNRYDLNDIILWVLNLFKTKNEVLLNYQEQYQYILVDEYQDTNGAQNELIGLLASYWDEPNVFVVGDDDQSIYRFQGANTKNMDEFRTNYNPKVIVLENNYRSNQPILNAAMQLIEQNDDRLVKKIESLSKNLKASNKDRVGEIGLPTVSCYKTTTDEMIGTCESIKNLIEKQNVKPSDIAVLYSKHEFGEKLSEFFRSNEIPFNTKKDYNLLKDNFINKCITILKYIALEAKEPNSANDLLFEILHYDFFNIRAIEIAKILAEFKTDNEKESEPHLNSLREYIYYKSTKPKTNLFDTSVSDEMKQLVLLLDDLIKESYNFSLNNFVPHAFIKIGITRYIMQHENKTWLLQITNSFINSLKVETNKFKNLKLIEWIELLEIMKENKIDMPITQKIGSDDGVQFMTLHGSKGLEFKYVFIINTLNTNFEDKSNQGIQFNLPKREDSKNENKENLNELRRLFYVGLTRAEQTLHLSYSEKNEGGKPNTPTRMLYEIDSTIFDNQQNATIIEGKFLKWQKVNIEPEVQIKYQSLLLTESKPQILENETDLINHLLSKFVMNTTALNNYLDCPLKFYYNNLLKIPGGKSPSTSFGTAIHNALEYYFKNHKKVQDTDKESIIGYFNFQMKKLKQDFTDKDYESYLKYGEIVLIKYYDNYKDHFNFITSNETNFTSVTKYGVPIRGRLDKIEFDGKIATVVDYKTGNFEGNYAKSNLKIALDGNHKNGNYWRQAIFYKILLDNNSKAKEKNWVIKNCIIDFIEPNSIGKFKQHVYEYNQEEIDYVDKLIKEVNDKILNKEFYVGCGDKDCNWCNFVKEHDKDVINLEVENFDFSDNET